MKSCEVFKKKKEYKIVTSYQVDVGRHSLDCPIFILPISASIEDLKTSIFRTLGESKKITYDEYYAGISPKELLKEMKETSFPKLYKDSTSCVVYVKDDIIEIVPYKCENPKEGLFPVTSAIVRIPYSQDNEIVIVEEIVKILNSEY